MEVVPCVSECRRKVTFWDGVAWSRQNHSHRLQPYQTCGT
jgi:hypothetical protein